MDAESTQPRDRLRAAYLEDEPAAMARLAALAALDPGTRAAIGDRAAGLVRAVRGGSDPGLMEEFLAEYGLSTREGVALMCLAEALLRVPDAETMDELIQDKISPHDWGAHLGRASSSLVNASTWALMLTGQVMDEREERGLTGTLHGLVRRLGEPVVRVAVSRAMRELGAQFVLGRDIGEAVRRGQGMEAKGYAYSYDMLGEAARTHADAQRYLGAYAGAIAYLAGRTRSDDIRANPGISVKLSALHPRYEVAHAQAMLPAMTARVLQLARAAAQGRMGFNIDAEEADRLDLSLDVIEAVLSDPSLAGWDGFGVVVQAYGPRAAHAIDWLYALAQRLDRRIMVRLVKGAYWDTEIKRAQVLGLDGFPVFTRKAHTDVSYIACARKLLGMTDRIYPQFATHNAHTASAVLAMTNDRQGFEFQRLHGMGEALHDAVMGCEGTRCRIYAPVGAHRDLLAYLVRRLLENGANSSFVHQIVDETVSPEEIARDPFEALERTGGRPNPAIARGPDIFEPLRRNARGWDITDPLEIARLEAARAPFRSHQWRAGDPGRPSRPVLNPADPSDVVGQVHEADAAAVEAAFSAARAAQPGWAAEGAAARAEALERAAALYEAHAPELMALACREAGKNWADGVSEVREACDFLRYYAARVRMMGERAPRGVIACISPWNFPLAIFTGQVAAALVTGNAVLAKPAEQTPLIAARAVALLHQAGVPADVLRLLPGDGPSVGGPLTALPGLGGVAFTGSGEVAHLIDRQLAQTAPEAVLIAETGGMNAMIVDSTALPEQAARDIVASAFQSAGQRCSALRVLYVQRDVEERFLEMLFGAMDALTIGDPWLLSTDIGPLIDEEAHRGIAEYCARMAAEGRLLHRAEARHAGHFLAPHVFRVRGVEAMEREIFGPVLHVARFDAEGIDGVIEAVNAKGYGLTFGVHTRVDGRVQHVLDRVRVGNVYVNRNQIGAVVGSQPFGGEGLSGTGPKAGGPLYLNAFVLADGRGAGRTAARAGAAQGHGAPAGHRPGLALRTGLGGAPGVGTGDAAQGLQANAAMRQAGAGQGGGEGASPLPPHHVQGQSGALPGRGAGEQASSPPTHPSLNDGAGGARVELGVLRAAFSQLDAPQEGRRDRVSALRASLRGRAAEAMAAAAALDPGPIDLPGPTGESNRYMLAPRGPVLALGPAEALLDQAVQALAAGNPVVAVGPGAGRLLEPLGECGLPFAAIDGALSPEDAAALPASVVAWAGDEARARALRRALATRDGPIARLVRDRIVPWEYCHERAICIDTTAAGGNTALLARAE